MIRNLRRIGLFVAGMMLAGCAIAFESNAQESRAGKLESGWVNPPRDARVRAYWWWLNGNVTKEAITRDLEEMKAKGFGGALICDADGSSQDGNNRAPHGPTFFSLEWRELYKHCLREADRLGLEMSLNIQSGWNLGGPMVTPDDAPKKLVWTEARVAGLTNFSGTLAQPKGRDGYYRDLFVLAHHVRKPTPLTMEPVTVTASSSQAEHPAGLARDGNPDTFWVSAGSKPGEGPSAAKPEWLQINLPKWTEGMLLRVNGRPGYGPRKGELQVSNDGKTFRVERPFEMNDDASSTFAIRAAAPFIRIVITEAYDKGSPTAPRNVQIGELSFYLKDRPLSLGPEERRRLLNWEQKALLKPLVPFSAPDSAPLFQELPARADEEDARVANIVDLTSKLAPDGTLRWEVPAGEWDIIRLGCTLNDHCRVSTCSEGWEGYALDPFDAGAFRRYWDAVVEPLIADAGPLAGKALKYLHTDSWEVEVANWTPTLREEFRKRRGYDLLPWLPVIAGKIVNSREESNRFLNDFRRTMGDLAIANHYQLFRDGAHKHGMLIHPESGGPHAVPIDAQQCLGFNDAPMSEFWAWSPRHRVGDANRFFVKQPASAAHTYGRKLVLAEGFTTIGPHWQETLWDNLKPSFDKALCEGLNLLVWHAFVCSPESEGIPGQQYFAGTHLNPLVTWWPQSGPFFDYLNRCQFMLQQGLAVADVAYYYGDHVPNFTQLKSSDPAKVLPGYDYDVVTSEVILTRMSVKHGRLLLPDGMSYRALVLPDREVISLPVLRKLKELVTAGATVIGPKPAREQSLKDFPACDAEVAKLAEELWGKFVVPAAAGPDAEPPKGRTTSGERLLGKGRVLWGKTAREVLQFERVRPDFEFKGDPDKPLDYIHRRDGDTDIYFIANRTNLPAVATCTFRVAGKAPELWHPVTGERGFAAGYYESLGRTYLPLEFAPCGSWFVVFREPASAHPATYTSNLPLTANSPRFTPVAELTGPWTVHFPRGMSADQRDDRERLSSATRPVVFDALTSWTTRPEPGIKFFSGTATYTKTFQFPAGIRHPASGIWLDLGSVRELAEVRVNGQSCGIVWAPPFRVDISKAVRPGTNTLAVDVVNFWPNRLIGDVSLPLVQRRTKTNIRKLTSQTKLMESGLLGPVVLLGEQP
ncbi:MAG: discoidin domain-containing protein [Verrucomicrobia bacterium]|jgi:hypothetical protein|nr:discoidin domain-containing protein [Verrucomicrobiota bacterium]